MNDSIKKEMLLNQLGSTWTLDGLFLFINAPTAIVSFTLNFLSLIVFKKLKLSAKKRFTQYLIVYSLFSMFICILVLMNSIAYSRRYFDFIFNDWTSFYICKILTWFTTSVFYFLNIMDCILLFERLTTLTNYRLIKSFFNYNSYLICFLLFLACNVINSPLFFVLIPRKSSEYIEVSHDLDKLTNFTYCYRDPFFSNQTGRSIIMLNVLLRDGLTLVIEISLSIYSLILFQKYLLKQTTQLTVSIANTNTISHQINAIENVDENQNSSRLMDKLESFNQGLTKMTLYLSLCSIISHFGTACCYILVSLDDKRNLLISSLIFTTFLLINLKFISNFFLFYHFNINFRAYIKCTSLISNSNL